MIGIGIIIPNGVPELKIEVSVKKTDKGGVFETHNSQLLVISSFKTICIHTKNKLETKTSRWKSGAKEPPLLDWHKIVPIKWSFLHVYLCQVNSIDYLWVV